MIIKEHKVVEKVWGREIWVINDESSNYCFKKLFLEKHKKCSYHMHKIKSEHFYIQSGEVLMMIGNLKEYKMYLMQEEDLIKIVPDMYHSFIGFRESMILEVSTYHREDDSYRLNNSGHVSNAEIFAWNELYKSGNIGRV